jgi:Ribonucleotide reductase, alpha subunit
MAWKSNANPMFLNEFSEAIFHQKYAHEGATTWDELCHTLVEDVLRDGVARDIKDATEQAMKRMAFIPGGRYLYYAGRPFKAFNNCFIFKSEEDSREDWAHLSWKAESALATGGGIGNDYSIYRPEGASLSRTGGVASGPLSKARMINEIGREVMQGGSRRSAIYASLDATHPDARKFLHAKDWDAMEVAGTGGRSIGDLKRADFNYKAPLDMTNISLNYKDEWLVEATDLAGKGSLWDLYIDNCRQALKTGEPGFSFNFGKHYNETGRNACTEVTTADDSDVCNLASINLANIDTLEELEQVTELATIFLLRGTLVAHLPFEKVYAVREKNRRLGLGLMGVHEWLLKRGYKYGMVDELRTWLETWARTSDQTAALYADLWSISRPVATRAIAPTGTIGILAGTTTGIEPVFAVAFKRRYLVGGSEWRYQYVVDSAAQGLIDRYGVSPDSIESALDLADDYERRIAFQADVQDFVDMGISSTINMPSWGSALNNASLVGSFATTLAKYAPRLRGFTCYPDGARGGQPLTRVDYKEAQSKLGQVFVETIDVCDISGKGGTCGS